MSLSDSRRIPAPVKQLGFATVDAWGRATQAQRSLPTFLLAGGQRCGTTSMYRALKAHPAIEGPVLRKGVHYFDVDFTQGDKWYRSHFPRRATLARASRVAGAPAHVFESSPYYMFHPAGPQRIAATLPNVRIVVLLRDPVERAYSAYAHERARGYEDLDLEAALAAEESRLAGETEKLLADPNYESLAHRHQAYVTRGQYVDALTELARHIDRERILVVDSHRFFADPLPEYNAVLTFLGLPAITHPPFEQNNARPRSPLAPELEERLRQHFRPYDERLAQWLGWSPSWVS